MSEQHLSAMLSQLISCSRKFARSIIEALCPYVSEWHHRQSRSITSTRTIQYHTIHSLLITYSSSSQKIPSAPTYNHTVQIKRLIRTFVSHWLFLTCCVIGLSTSGQNTKGVVVHAFYIGVKMQEASSERVRTLKASTYSIHIHITDSHNATSTHTNKEHTDCRQAHRPAAISFSFRYCIYPFARP